MKLTPDPLLLMRIGENPLIVKKLRYYTDKEFAGMLGDRDGDIRRQGEHPTGGIRPLIAAVGGANGKAVYRQVRNSPAERCVKLW